MLGFAFRRGGTRSSLAGSSSAMKAFQARSRDRLGRMSARLRQKSRPRPGLGVSACRSFLRIARPEGHLTLTLRCAVEQGMMMGRGRFPSFRASALTGCKGPDKTVGSSTLYYRFQLKVGVIGSDALTP